MTKMHDRQGMVYTLAILARLSALQGQAIRAGRLWGAIEAEEARAFHGRWERERDHYAGPLLAGAGPDFEHGRQQGRRLSLTEAIANAEP